MAEYIEREAAIESLPVAWDSAINALRNAPSADVAPVVHGRWKCHGDCGVTECSACGWSIEEYVGDYAYCPNCGSRMYGDDDAKEN